MPAIAHDYKPLQSNYGVNFVRARAYQVKSNAVVLEDGTKVPFGRAEVCPAMDVCHDAFKTAAGGDGKWWNRRYLSPRKSLPLSYSAYERALMIAH